jgi:hypothetical protein
MMNPNVPPIPGMDAMTDTLEFVKSLWGSMGLPGMGASGIGMPGMSVPGMVMPTLSVDELNKKIADLKAVESWLNLNLSMLRSTIQALEVQAATISALQSMGDTFSATMHAGLKDTAGPADVKQERAPEPSSKDQSDAAAFTAPLLNAAAWWNMLQDQFKQAVDSAMAEPPEAAPAPAPKAAAKTGAKPKTAAAPAPPKTRRKTGNAKTAATKTDDKAD